MKSKYLSILAGVALAIGTTSCELDFQNPNGYDAGNFWQTEANFTGNLTALMNQWRGMDGTMLETVGELRTDYYWNGGSLDGSGLTGLEYVNNTITYGTPGLSNYAGIYGLISNFNTYLYYDSERGEKVFGEKSAIRSYMLGMVYGMRAYWNFQIHKLYGTGPIRDDAQVIQGVYDDKLLMKPQASVDDFLANIKKDIELSLKYFEEGASANNAVFKSHGGQIYWSKAATELLAGEYHLWIAKVSTVGTNGEGHKATGEADVKIAQKYFENVANNYGYKLMADYSKAINTNSSGNTERIFGTYYALGEASTNWYNYIQYDPTVGGSPGNYWNCVENDGVTPSPNAARLTYKYLPGEENVSVRNTERTTYFTQRMGGQQRRAVRNAYYYQFSTDDNRTVIFQPLYLVKEDEKNIQNIANFNFEEHDLAGNYVWKYHGELEAATNKMGGFTYMTYYRLPLVYAYLAECANFLGDNANVEKYVNLIRQRAYGGLRAKKDNYTYGELRNNWDAEKYGYKAGDFKQNEIAILQEKAKEFFQEGQRWWDLRRMTTVKNGQESDHMIFRPEGCIGYGLDLAAHPKWFELTPTGIAVGTNKIVTDQPVLDYAIQKHLVLWPLDKTLLTKDDQLKQTPGYDKPEKRENW